MTRSYKEDLLFRLRDAKYCRLYLKAALKDPDDSFLLAVRDVAEANPSITKSAEASEIDRLRAALDARDAAIKAAEKSLRGIDISHVWWTSGECTAKCPACQVKCALAALAAAKEGK